MSSHESKHSSLRRPVAAPTSQSPKPEGSSQPVDVSSQGSAEGTEISLIDIPAEISPIAIVSHTESTTPPAEEPGPWAITNQALEDWLTAKAFIDACRQRTIGGLGLLLCLNDFQAAEAVSKARSIHSQATLEAKSAYSQSVIEAKTACTLAVRKAKTTRRLPGVLPSMKLMLTALGPPKGPTPRGLPMQSHCTRSTATSCGI